MARELLAYIPLNEATRRYRIGAQALTQMVEKGTIRAVRINGSVAVAETDVTDVKDMPNIPAPTDEMKGQGIRAVDAIKKYQVASHSTLAGWRQRGIVAVIKRNHKKVIYDEYTVASAAQVYHATKKKQGIRYSKTSPS